VPQRLPRGFAVRSLPSPKQVLRKFDSQGIQVTVNRLIYHFLQRARTVIERIRGITTAPISAT
jgi:hypothetical protein